MVTSKTSHADHIKPVNSFANLAMANDLDNIQTLCRRCHELTTAREQWDWNHLESRMPGNLRVWFCDQISQLLDVKRERNYCYGQVGTRPTLNNDRQIRKPQMATRKSKATEPAQLTVLGIDLGTTNSTASLATASPSGPVIKTLNIDQETLQGTYTHTLVPSVVALAQGKEWVGEGAKRLRGNDTELYASIFHECKNDIGLKRTYHKAPKGYRSAAEMGGKILQFLHQAASAEHEGEFDRVVVTVPASFDAHQRADTLLAAQLGGIELAGGDLLDEPVAAFIDYLAIKPDLLAVRQAATRILLVFDFGGGTCDIAIFRLQTADEAGKLNIATLAVSRYQRLGGGDVDAAVLHEVLVPQLLQQNGLSTFDLEYREKKLEVEPALMGVAEQLKIKICDEVRKLQGFGRYDDTDRSEIIVKQPGTINLTVAGKALKLSSPALSAAQFENALAPFLDRDLLYARETEYRLTCSIFAPLQDALDRGGVSPRAVDLCLTVGGSSLIPQVAQALDEYLPNARILTYRDKESVMTGGVVLSEMLAA